MESNLNLPNLITKLRASNPWTRSHAAEELGHIGDTTAIPALIEALQDEHEDVRCNAARALGDIGSPDALPALTTALTDDHGTVRVWVAYALGRLGAVPPLIEALKDPDWKVGLAEMAKPSLSSAGRGFVRARAADALCTIGEPARVAIPALKAALNDPHEHVWHTAKKALERLEN